MTFRSEKPLASQLAYVVECEPAPVPTPAGRVEYLDADPEPYRMPYERARCPLEAWGAWRASQPIGIALRGLQVPVLVRRELLARFARRVPKAYDTGQAVALEQVMACTLEPQLLACLVLRWVTGHRPRQGAELMSLQGWHCAPATFRRWCDDAEALAEAGRPPRGGG